MLQDARSERSSSGRKNVKQAGEVSVNEMMTMIGRAYLATGQPDAARAIRALPYNRLVDEYHWAMVTLDQRGLLSHEERETMSHYARDYVASSWASNEA